MSSLPTGIGLPLLAIACLISTIACLIMSLRNLGRKRLIEDTPTSKTKGVFIGLTELKGTAESEAPLTSYLTGIRCVQYDWRIEEKWSRLVTETYQDSEGKTQTRTRTESGWANVGNGGESPTFYLKDETGVIRVNPEGASIEGETTISDTYGRDDGIYFQKGPPVEVVNSDHRRRFVETAIPLHSTLYVLGQARERDDTVAAEITRDKDASLYVISTKTEKHVGESFGQEFLLWITLGLLVAMISAFALTGLSVLSISSSFALYFLAVAAGYVLVVYNSLTTLSNSVSHAWSLVDVQLKRRSDLIRNLVEAVEGYNIHEKDIQLLTSELRKQESTLEPGHLSEIRGLASTINAASERYPDLLAGESFIMLQRSLIETEQRIALARDYFNEITNFYNTRIVVVPDMLVAKMLKLRPRPLLTIENFERAAVKVTLTT